MHGRLQEHSAGTFLDFTYLMLTCFKQLFCLLFNTLSHAKAMTMMQIDPARGKTIKNLLANEFELITATHNQPTQAVSRQTIG